MFKSLQATITPLHCMTDQIVYVEHMTVHIIVFLFDVYNHMEYFDITVLCSLYYICNCFWAGMTMIAMHVTLWLYEQKSLND